MRSLSIIVESLALHSYSLSTYPRKAKAGNEIREMVGIDDVLFGAVTTNRNRKACKKKPGVYVSPELCIFNFWNAEGKRLWKRIPAGFVGRGLELVEAGKRWKKSEAAYETLATEAAWSRAAGKNTSDYCGCG